MTRAPKGGRLDDARPLAIVQQPLPSRMRAYVRSLLAALPLLAGAAHAQTPAPGGTLLISIGADADALFPPLTNLTSGRQVSDQLFERLAEIGPRLNTIGDTEFAPRLARRWRWSRDSLSIAFELDPRARWHDGRPVRASDVRFSWEVYTDPAVASPTAPLLRANIDSVTARDARTAVVWFKRRTPEQFYDATYQMHILPEHVYGSVPRDQLRTSSVLRQPVGSGRFRFVRWEPGARIEVVAHRPHYRGRALLDRVIWLVAPDFNSGVSRFLAGGADWFETVLPTHYDQIRRNPALALQPYPVLQYAYMGMNMRAPDGSGPHPLFADRALRRALSMAVDRRALLKNVFGDLGALAFGPFPRNLGVADTTIPQLPFDRARAARELDALGWRMAADGVRVKDGRPLRFTMLVPTSSAPRVRYATLLQEQFRQIGARAEVEPLEIAAFLDRMSKRSFDVVVNAYGTDPSPGGSRQSWGSSGLGAGGSNVLSYANATFDARLDSALASYSAARTRAQMRRAYAQIVEDAPAIWLYEIRAVAGRHRRVRPVGLRADAWWANLADWYVPPAARLDRDRTGTP